MERYVRYPIEQGAQIPRGYSIIVIPDTTQLKVEIKVHETWINKIELDQKARITTTAFPDKVFAGKVLKKAPMADSQSYSLLADVKVYTTDVSIEGTHDYLRTGMTAKVEISIDELKDVLYVPIQSVVTEEDEENKKICYVMTDKGHQRREVEIGLFNDDFVEIKSGLVEGEQVLLNPPRWTETKKTEEEKTEKTEKVEGAEKTEETKKTEEAEGEEKTEQTEKMKKKEETGEAKENVVIDKRQPD